MARRATKSAGDGNAAKYITVLTELRSFIGAHPEGTRLPSFAQLRREHGVSQDTIERALDELDRAGLIVREYRRGIFISRNAKLRRFGVVLGGEILAPHVSPVYRILLDEIRARVLTRRQSFDVFYNMREVNIDRYGVRVDRKLKDTLDQGKLDGLILLFTQGEGEIRWLADYQIPLVVMTNVLHGLACGAYIDLGAVTRLGTEALFKQGCRRIALLAMAGHQRNQGFTDDLDAYESSLAELGLERRSEWIWDKAGVLSEAEVFNGTNNEEIAYHAIRDLLLRASGGTRISPDSLPFDGLVSTDDMATRGIIAGLREFGIAPGRDLKIASHINRGSPALLGYERDITLVEVEPAQIADALLSLLDRLTEGKRIAQGRIELTGARIAER